jgi:hypothetical protein
MRFTLPGEEVVQLSSCLLATIYFTLPLAGESGAQAQRRFANPPRVCESSPGLFIAVHHGLVWVGKNAGGFFEG